MSIQYAQSVCLNGHQQSSSVKWGQEVSGFCEQCGEKLISSCPNCGYPISGNFDVTDDTLVDFTWMSRKIPVPNYCHECSKPYPWTQTRIQATQEIIDLSELYEAGKQDFKSSIKDLLVDTPRTKIATFKYNKYIQKMGEFAGNSLKEVLVVIASEAAKKSIGL